MHSQIVFPPLCRYAKLQSSYFKRAASKADDAGENTKLATVAWRGTLYMSTKGQHEIEHSHAV
jgi:hypothetical protein